MLPNKEVGLYGAIIPFQELITKQGAVLGLQYFARTLRNVFEELRGLIERGIMLFHPRSTGVHGGETEGERERQNWRAAVIDGVRKTKQKKKRNPSCFGLSPVGFTVILEYLLLLHGSADSKFGPSGNCSLARPW